MYNKIMLLSTNHQPSFCTHPLSCLPEYPPSKICRYDSLPLSLRPLSQASQNKTRNDLTFLSMSVADGKHFVLSD